MATATKTWTVTDFLATPVHRLRRELVFGELVDSPHPTQRHGRLVATL